MKGKIILSAITAAALTASAAMNISVFAAGDKVSEYVPFTDTDNTEIEILARCGIINGYDDGSFKPDNTVTRAEAAAILSRILNMDLVLSVETEMKSFPELHQEPLFSDIDSTYWAYPSIKAAGMIGIISGYDDGSFRPSDNVTEEQLAKMAVAGCGYDSLAQIEGYPQGYVKCAQTLGLCESAEDAPATRGYIAHVAYNMLHADAQYVDGWIFNSDGSLSPTTVTVPYGAAKSSGICQIEGTISDVKDGTVTLKVRKTYAVYEAEQTPLLLEGETYELPYKYSDISELAGKECYLYITYIPSEENSLTVVYAGDTP